MNAPRSYNRLKRETEEGLVLKLRAAGLKPGALAGRQVTVGFTFHEPTRHRDPDGIFIGALKLVMDALSRRGKYMHCDGHHCVLGFERALFIFPRDDEYQGPGVVVRLRFWIEENAHHGAVDSGGANYWLPGLLPEANELLAAREEGARRMVARNLRAKWAAASR